MEGNTIISQKDLFGNDMKALPKKLEETVAGLPTSSSEWPSLPGSQVTKESPANSIPPGKKPPANSAMPVSWSIKKKSAEDREKDRVEKYALYFQGILILHIPEFGAAVEPKNLSFIITDLRTRRLAGLKKETFAGVVSPHRMSCYPWRSWQQSWLAVTSLQNTSASLDYKRKRTDWTVCNVPLQLNEDVLAVYLSTYGSVEETTPIRSADGTAHGDNVFNISMIGRAYWPFRIS